MKDIWDVVTIEKVRTAYARIGKGAKRGSWACLDGTCALGAVYWASRNRMPPSPDEVSEFLNVPLGQTRAFILGFDAVYNGNPFDAERTPGAFAAFAHGQSIANEVLSAPTA